MSNLFEVFVIAALIVLNGVLSMSETAMVSSRRARLQARAESGSGGARTALALLNAPNQFLATIQIGISLIGVLAGAFGGATLAGYLANWLDNSATLEPYSSALALAIVVLLISYFTLVIGELVPKRLALRSPEPIATKVARPVATLARLTRPVVYLLSASTEAVLRLLRIKPSTEPQVTVEEITLLIREGAELGVFQRAEQEIALSVFELNELRAAEIMTPRPKIVWIDLEDDSVDNFSTIAASPHARFPVAEGGLDHVIGILHVKQLWAQTLIGSDVSLRRSIVPPIFVPESASVLNVMEAFRSSEQQLALVVDEFGGVQGLITVTDILETIVGELHESETGPQLGVVRRDGSSWLMDGTLPIHEVREVLTLEDELPGEAQGNFQTLGGFVMSELERIPRESDSVEWQGIRFEVVDMDGNRVDKVLVERRDRADQPGRTPHDERESSTG
jgi:putative hemolysin